MCDSYRNHKHWLLSKRYSKKLGFVVGIAVLSQTHSSLRAKGSANLPQCNCLKASSVVKFIVQY